MRGRRDARTQQEVITAGVPPARDAEGMRGHRARVAGAACRRLRRVDCGVRTGTGATESVPERTVHQYQVLDPVPYHGTALDQ